MKVEKKVQELLDKVQAGKLNEHLHALNGSDFGIYIPTYVDGDTVKLMKDGYSQSETNLKVTVNKGTDKTPGEALTVGWLRNVQGKDSSCSHGTTHNCKHCTSHGSKCHHCTGHKNSFIDSDLIAPELDYHSAMGELKTKEGLLNSLGKEEFGLALLHGHNNEFMFTKLPEGYVSVISDHVTTFRPEAEVKKDPTFIPNMWRSVNGGFRVAGGYSKS